MFSLPSGSHNRMGSLPDSSFLRVGQAGSTADRTRGGSFHPCSSVRCSGVVSRSHRATWPDPGLLTVPFPSSDASIPESLSLGGGKTRVSSEVGQQGGRSPTSPGSRSCGAGRSGRRARTPAPPDAAPGSGRPGERPRCALDRRREGHPRPECLRPPGRRRRRRCRYRTAPSASGTSSSGGH